MTFQKISVARLIEIQQKLEKRRKYRLGKQKNDNVESSIKGGKPQDNNENESINLDEIAKQKQKEKSPK